MSFDRKYLVWGLSYLVVGMCLGIFMAASNDHSQFVTHAHINLAGFLLSFAYAALHKLWLGQPNATLSWTQFIVHQTGAILMAAGLFMLFGKFAPEDQLEPILKVSSLLILVAAVLMFYMVLKSKAGKA